MFGYNITTVKQAYILKQMITVSDLSQMARTVHNFDLNVSFIWQFGESGWNQPKLPLLVTFKATSNRNVSVLVLRRRKATLIDLHIFQIYYQYVIVFQKYLHWV